MPFNISIMPPLGLGKNQINQVMLSFLSATHSLTHTTQKSKLSLHGSNKEPWFSPFSLTISYFSYTIPHFLFNKSIKGEEAYLLVAMAWSNEERMSWFWANGKQMLEGPCFNLTLN